MRVVTTLRFHTPVRIRVRLLCGLTLFLGSCTSKQEEPSFGLGSRLSGEMVRQTSLKEMLPNPARVVYEVQYPGVGLSSLVTLDLQTHAMLEELFAGKWRIVYEYSDMQDKLLQVPTTIIIYSGREGSHELINRYDRVELVPQEGARYRDRSRRTRMISYEYFQVVPGEPF